MVTSPIYEEIRRKTTLPRIIVQGMPFEKSQLKSRSWLFQRRRALLLFYKHRCSQTRFFQRFQLGLRISGNHIVKMVMLNILLRQLDMGFRVSDLIKFSSDLM